MGTAGMSIQLERSYMAVRLAVFTPEYLASHQEFSDSDHARLMDTILEYRMQAEIQCEHGNTRNYCAECGKKSVITCQRCDGHGEIDADERGMLKCPVCDGAAVIDYALVAEYARQIDRLHNKLGNYRPLLEEFARRIRSTIDQVEGL
jgi:hypothetical protein